jgi:geranylgeranyl pyrophosphate synthase
MTESGFKQPVVVQFPDQFQGVFKTTKSRFAPLIAEARTQLRDLKVPDKIQPYYSFAVLDRPQPSYMLLPLMFLATAEQHGGITDRHRAYLPWYMLMMEVCAIVDDTVDRTPLRSGRDSFPEHYSDAAATAFGTFLISKVFEKTVEVAPELVPLTARCFEVMFATSTWEIDARYPAVEPAQLAAWVRNRYETVEPFISHSFNSALRLNGRGEVGYDACLLFAEVMQDVDDVVSIVEQREINGENDDIKLGVVTHPLLSMLDAQPESLELLERYWRPFRSIPTRSRDDFNAGVRRCSANSAAEYAELSRKVVELGVPETVAKAIACAKASAERCPPELRACVGDIALSFVDRLRSIDARADFTKLFKEAS